MKKYLFLVATAIVLIPSLFAQSPKREMRAAWMATVWRIDWPSNVIYTTGNVSQINQQKTAMIRYLDSIQVANMNTVFFQVRSRSDAMYNSSYEPWSSDLVATRGMEPGYDPLAFAIEEAHKRGIELHAWLNPYRYETTDNQFVGPEDYRTTNPEWLLDYSNGYAILNPGLPEVKQRITDVVQEIVTNYDVDGIVFDDYFYAYGGTPTDLDLATQQLYKPATMNVHDWRRKNVNDMILSVYTMIQQVKPYVTFGVSPFGIWTTNQTVAQNEGVPLPPGITGGNMYQEIYCDPIAWLKQGSVDYISPQLYWPTTSTGQDYDILAPWWADVALRFGKHFYSSNTLSGMAAYTPTRSANVKHTEANIPENTNAFEFRNELIPTETLSPFEKQMLLSTGEVKFTNVTETGTINYLQPAMSTRATGLTAEEIGLQIIRNRLSAKDDAPGSVFYSIKGLYTSGFTTYLRNFIFTHKSLQPAINWKPTQNYGMVDNISVTGTTLAWDEVDPNVRYTVYAIPNSRVTDVSVFQTSEFLKGISYSPTFDVTGIDASQYTFGVAVLDRYGNEFPVRLQNQPITPTPSATLISPDNNAEIVFGTPHNVLFNWSEVTGVYAYFLEVDTSATFESIIFSRELTETSFSSDSFSELTDGVTYYWRVRTRMAGSVDGLSEVRSFTAQSFKLITPINNQTNVSLQPLIQWTKIGDFSNVNYKVELATGASFTSTQIIYSASTTLLEHQIPEAVLSGSSTYYLRVTAETTEFSMPTTTVIFKTETAVPDIPQIIYPDEQYGVEGYMMHISWTEDVRATSFRVEISQSNTFPPRGSTILTTPAFKYNIDYTAPASGTYYIRVRANYGTGLYTEWSDVRVVDIQPTSIGERSDAFNVKFVRTGLHKQHLIMNVLQPSVMSINVFSLTGVKVSTIYAGNIEQGEHTFEISLGNYPKGVYLVYIESDSAKIIQKIVN